MSLRSWCGLAGALLLAACGSSSSTTPDGGSLGTVFTLAVANTGSGSGSVFSNPTGISCGSTCSATFAQGSQVILTPLARTGSIFTGWSGDCSGSGSTCSVTMSASKSVQANFEVITHPVAVTISGNGSGTVVSDPTGLSCSSGTCSASFTNGTTVNLTATPSADSAFGSWSGDCAGVTSNVCTVHADQARNVGVSFILTAARLTVTVNGNGDGTVDSNPAGITGCSATGGTCAANFTPGTQVTLTAAPGINSTPSFAGCDSASGNLCTVTVSAATSVTLTYSRPQLPLSVTVNGTGAGTVDSTPQGINGCSATGGTCAGNFGEGLPVTLTASPDVASAVSWTGCDSASGNSCTVTMAAAANVTATFNHVNHSLTVNLGGTGTVSGAGLGCAGATCTGTYLQGSQLTLTAAPGAGKTVTWTGCDSATGNSCAVTMGSDKTVSAAFNMTLVSITPADGATGVAANTVVVLTFSAPINAATATTGTTCANDTVLLSSSGGSFASCRSATLTVNGNQVTLKPGSTLTANKLYKIRVTLGLTDTAGDTLAAQYQSAGFTTAVTASFAVSNVTPADRATGIATSSAIGVTFATAADPLTITSNTTDTTCSGSLQVSRDGFSTCVQMAAAPVASGSNTIFSVTPAAALQSGATYQVRVTTAAKDAGGNALGATFTTATGFTTSSAAPASLTVTVNGTGSGTVDSSPAGISACSASGGTCSANFSPGTVVTLTASPSGGATPTFTGCDSASGNSCTVTVNAATSVTLTYSLVQFALGVTVNGTGTGTVASSPAGITGCSASGGTCSANFGQGATVTLTAAPDAASVVSWTGCTSSSGNSCSVNMAAAENVTATFNQVSHVLTVNLTGAGSLSAAGLTCTGATCTGTYLQGTAVQLTATPGGAGETTNWTGCDSSSGNTCNMTMSADKTVGASFNMTLVSIAPADGATGVANTTAVVLTFSSPIDGATASTSTTCATGSVEMSASGGSFSGTGCRTVTLAVSGNQVTITPNTNLTASKLYKIQVSTALKDTAGNPLGALFQTPTGFTTDSAWAVTSVSPADGTTGVGTNSTVSVTFNRAASLVTAQAASGACSGSFQVSSTSTFSSCVGGTLSTADSLTWTFTPAAALTANTLYKVKVTTAARDANGSALPASFTSAGFTTGSSTNRTLSVTLDTAGGTVTSTPAGMSCSSGTCTGTFADGTAVTLSAGPNANVGFIGWAGDCVGTSCSLTMNADRTVTAHYLTVSAVSPSDGLATAASSGVVVTGFGFTYGSPTITFGSQTATCTTDSNTQLTCSVPANGTAAKVDVTVVDAPATAALPSSWTFTGVANNTAGQAGYCTTQWPDSTTTFAGSATETLYGQIFVNGLTPNDGTGIRAQVGYGPATSNPSTDGSWKFVNASWESNQGNNDQFTATLVAPNVSSPATYAYGYRFSQDSGLNWTYCDLNDQGGTVPPNLVDPAKIGTWTVNPVPVVTLSTVSPNNGLATATTPNVVVTGTNFTASTAVTFGGAAATCTLDSATQLTCSAPTHAGAAIVDVVASDSGKSATLTGAWTYTGVANGQSGQVDWCTTQWPDSTTTVSGATTETIYGQLFLTGLTPNDGTGLLAQVGYGAATSDPTTDGSWRFTAAAWDSNQGNNDQYATTLVAPNVSSTTSYSYAYRFSHDNGLNWTYCDLNSQGGTSSPNAIDPGKLGTWTVNPSSAPTITSLSPSNGLASGTTASVVVTGTNFTGSTAITVGAQTATCTLNSATQLTCSVPANASSAAARVNVVATDGASSTLTNGWTYTGVANGTSNQVDWCSTQWPDSTTTASGATTETLFGQVFVSGGVTPAGTGLTAQVGYGPATSNPSTDTSWRFFDATYDSAQGNNAQYATTLVAPTVGTTTSYSYVYRYSRDSGLNWTYCDLNSQGGTGTPNAVDATKLGTWTVTP